MVFASFLLGFSWFSWFFLGEEIMSVWLQWVSAVKLAAFVQSRTDTQCHSKLSTSSDIWQEIDIKCRYILTEIDPKHHNFSTRCTGSLIDTKTILTAAHCLDNVHVEDIRLVLGSDHVNVDNQFWRKKVPLLLELPCFPLKICITPKF